MCRSALFRPWLVEEGPVSDHFPLVGGEAHLGQDDAVSFDELTRVGVAHVACGEFGFEAPEVL